MGRRLDLDAAFGRIERGRLPSPAELEPLAGDPLFVPARVRFGLPTQSVTQTVHGKKVDAEFSIILHRHLLDNVPLVDA